MSVLLSLHEAEGFRGVAPASCANHAAAFFNWYDRQQFALPDRFRS
jgi:hypothetical protein